MGTRRSYGGLDHFRMIAAVLVIAIHTSPLASFGPEGDFFLTRVLARVAVPFFFMVTGQFVLSDVLTRKRGSRRRLFRYLKKTALLYGIAICIYIPIGIYAGHYKEMTVGILLKMLFFDGTFYHLWYFPACLLGVMLVYLMSRCMDKRGMTAVAGVLYVLGLLGDSYYGLTQSIPVLSAVYEAGFQIFSYTRNGIFFAPLFLILGAEVGGEQPSGNKKDTGERGVTGRGFDGLLLVFSFLAMTGEAFLLRYLDFQRHDSMYLALIPTMICLYRVLLSWDRKPAKVLRILGAWIYILHPAMIVVVRGGAKAVHMTELLVDNSLGHYLAVTVLSVIAAFLVSLLVIRLSRVRFGCSRAWVELDMEALGQNADFLKSRLKGECLLMPAVKANAYGHGAVLVAGELNRRGVRAFCVACAEEGADLRAHGIEGEILILGYTHPDEFDLLLRYGLTQTVVDVSYGELLDRYGRAAKRKIPVHIGVDTGMHRIGEAWENVEGIAGLFHREYLVVEGLFTHLCADDVLKEREREFTLGQARAFYELADRLKGRGCFCPKLHLQSSYSVLNYPELAGDYARVGIALYGVLSTREDTEKWKNALKPVLSLKARVAAVKNLHPGEAVGYGLQFTADKEMQIATLSIGYADGLPRDLSGGVGSVLIGGVRAPILGRMCMDQTIVDISRVPMVQTGDEAVLIGRSGGEEITAADLAEQAGTITNEILSRLGARLERTVVRGEVQ